MFKRAIAFSIKHSSLVLILAGLLVAYAGASLPRIPVDVFPELNAPTVTILTEGRGLNADEVELYVSFPIESSMNGLPGVRRVRSSSAMSLSIVWVEFEFGQDIYRARQLVSERLSAAAQTLPPGVHPELAPISGLTGEIMLLSVTAAEDGVSPLTLRGWAEFELRNRLLAVAGVSQVVAVGGELPEYQINVDQQRLALYGLTIADVVEAASKAHATASAGYLPDVQGQELPLRQSARITSEADIRATLIRHHNGVPVTIGDVVVADDGSPGVGLGPAPRRGTGSESGRPAVILTVQKQPGTNTLEITRRIDEMLDRISHKDADGRPTDIVPVAEDGRVVNVRLNRHVMRQADFIGLSVRNVLVVLRDA
ncbi:MAG: efflux RND transporter permease subunit, partial [Planctomycetes bacterium]|nr:efflux RND transporter permease subunit [Planctomycetota bacterium]